MADVDQKLNLIVTSNTGQAVTGMGALSTKIGQVFGAAGITGTARVATLAMAVDAR